jgi:DNA (cytosine-5)-methyltransferase 1
VARPPLLAVLERAPLVTRRKPTAISTFAGGGGSSTGYERAGYRVAAAVEWDSRTAGACYHRNHPKTPLLLRDITTLDAAELLAAARLEPGHLDVLDGSPPCQSFSSSNPRAKPSDDRNQLFYSYARLLRDLQPRAFVAENVAGMVRGRNVGVARRVLDELEACGYRVTAALVDFSRLGVPQQRVRVIILGARQDLGIEPRMIEPQTPPTTCHQATRDLDEAAMRHAPPASAIATRRWRAAKPRQRFCEITPTYRQFNYFKLDPHQPCQTITKTPTLYHWSRPRLLSIEELTRFGGFPDDYQWDSWRECQHVIGNSVPPEAMRRIALHVRATILDPAHKRAAA